MQCILHLKPDLLGDATAAFAWQTSVDRPVLAYSCTNTNSINLFTDEGEHFTVIDFKDRAKVEAIKWDYDGEVLAVFRQLERGFYLWGTAQPYSQCVFVKTHRKEVVQLSWCKHSQLLVVALLDGTVILYDKHSKTVTTMEGETERAILPLNWSCVEDIFILLHQKKCILYSIADNQKVVLERDENPLHCFILRTAAYQVYAQGRQFPSMDSRLTVAGVVTLSGVFCVTLSNKVTHGAEYFPKLYGTVTSCCSVLNGIAVGFSKGSLIIYALQSNLTWQINYNGVLFSYPITGIAMNESLQQLAVLGEREVKFVSMRFWDVSFEDDLFLSTSSRHIITMIDWNNDKANRLTFSTSNGHLYCYASLMKSIYTTYGDTVASFTSGRELSIRNSIDISAPSIKIEVPSKPDRLALGRSHCAVAHGTEVSYYAYDLQDGFEFVMKLQYDGVKLTDICLDDHHSFVITDGTLHCHKVIDQKEETPIKSFGKLNGTQADLALVLGERFLCIKRDADIWMYSLLDFEESCSYSHERHIARVYPNSLGTCIIFADIYSNFYLFEIAREIIVNIPQFPEKIEGILWSLTDKNIFLSYCSMKIQAYIYYPVTIEGPAVHKVRQYYLSPSQQVADQAYVLPFESRGDPVLLHDTLLIFLTKSGKLEEVSLFDSNIASDHEDRSLLQIFCQLSLGKFDLACSCCERLVEDINLKVN